MPLIQTPGLHIHYRQAGDGPENLILLHGNFASCRWWQPLLDDPPSGYRLYAPDLRGCGDSEKPLTGYTLDRLAEDLAGFASALELERFHLVGHSLGGAAALHYTSGRPHRVTSLILVTPPPAGGFTAQNHQSALAGLISPQAIAHWLPDLALHRTILDRALDYALPGLDGGSKLQPLVEDALHMSPAAVSGYAQALYGWDIRDKLARLRLPVLIVAGRLDPLINPDTLDAMADALPDARLMVWPDTGHAPQLEHPQRFKSLLTAFLEAPQHPRALANAAPSPAAMEASDRGKFHKLWDRLEQVLLGNHKD